MAISERLFYFVSGALLLLGGALFLWGGIQAQHQNADGKLVEQVPFHTSP